MKTWMLRLSPYAVNAKTKEFTFGLDLTARHKFSIKVYMIDNRTPNRREMLMIRIPLVEAMLVHPFESDSQVALNLWEKTHEPTHSISAVSKI